MRKTIHSDNCAGGPADPLFSEEGVSISVRSLPGMGEPPRLEAKPSAGLLYFRETVESRRSSHTVSRLGYHFVFITQYRNPVLKGDMAKEIRELTKEICRTHDIEILKGHIRPDHIQILLDVPPRVSPSMVIQAIKGKTSHHMLQDYHRLRREFWGRHLWASGYPVATTGTVTDESTSNARTSSPRTMISRLRGSLYQLRGHQATVDAGRYHRLRSEEAL